MSEALTIVLNGRPHTFPEIISPTSLTLVLSALSLKADRIAVEHNGDIVPRAAWQDEAISEGDRLEIVHFVGGGLAG